jgi:hypothetical protein
MFNCIDIVVVMNRLDCLYVPTLHLSAPTALIHSEILKAVENSKGPVFNR